MAGFDVAFWRLLFKLVSRQTGDISNVTFQAQKPRFRNTPIQQPFERATPESQGVKSKHIRHFLEDLGNDGDANPQHVMILRHGKVIAECSYAPYPKQMWHVTHSLCKSVTGMAVGIAIHEGLLSLDDTLDDIFPQYVKLLSKIRHKPVTVENLLNMTSEVEFSESGAISGDHWISGYMDSAQKCDPGTKFDYNSMNSYMLSAIIQEKTKMTMFEYLKPRLFEPLGIEEVFWEHSPEGITKGGWGMYLRPEDACKLGWMYLCHGRWKDQQIVPASWVEASTQPQVDNGKFGYGYQIWMEERPGSYEFNGLFGQNVICCPDDDMIIMCNAGNNELIAGGSLTSLIREYWGSSYHPSDEPLQENIMEYRKLNTVIGQMDGTLPPAPKPMKPGLNLVLNKTEVIDRGYMAETLKGHFFTMEKKQLGLFPLICQVMHVNFTDGISRIGFDVDKDNTFVVLFQEGEKLHRVRVGFEEAEESEIFLHKDPYVLLTKGRVASDENDRLALILDIIFPEEGMLRRLKIFFDGDEIEVRSNEKPGDAVAVDALEYTGGGENMLTRLPFVRNIMEGGGIDLMDVTIQSTIHPIDYGKLES